MTVEIHSNSARVITNAHYTVCVTSPRSGQVITVASNKKGGGIMLKSDHPQHSSWLDAFQTVADDGEFSAFCRALLN